MLCLFFIQPLFIHFFQVHQRCFFSQSTPNQEEECTSVKQDSSFGEASGREATSALARTKAIAGLGDSLASMTDEYFVYLHSCLWNIIQDTKRVQDILSETLEDN